MTIAQLRALAAHHDEESTALDQQALRLESVSLTYGGDHDATVVTLRERAQWHSSTAILLREFADAICQIFHIQP